MTAPDEIGKFIKDSENDPQITANVNEMEKEGLAKKEAQKVSNEQELKKDAERVKALIEKYRQQFESIGVSIGLKTQRIPRMSAFWQDDYNDYFLTLEKNGKFEEVALPWFISNSFSIKSGDMMTALFEWIKAGKLEVKDFWDSAEWRQISVNNTPIDGLSFRMRKGHPDYEEAKTKWWKPEVWYYAWVESMKKAVESISGS